jgi:hypothetical protein
MIVALRFLQILPWLATNPLRIKTFVWTLSDHLMGHFLSPPVLAHLHICSSNSPNLTSKFFEGPNLLG